MTSLPQSFLLLPPPKSRGFAIIQKKSALLTIRRLMSKRPTSKPESIILSQLRMELASRLKKNPKSVISAIQIPEIATPIIVNGCPQIRTNTALIQLTHLLGFKGQWDLTFDALRLSEAGEIAVFEPPANGYRRHEQGFEISMNGNWMTIKELKQEKQVSTIPIFPLLGGQDLTLWDSNPLFQVEAHPEKEGNAINLSDRPPETWVDAINNAMKIIRESLPEWWGEFPAALKRIVPVGYHPERHESASYAEALGVAYTSLHPNSITMAEAIIHETQHNKLNTLLQLEPVLANGSSCWTSSPVRPDMRPLNGVLLAAHAFVPVAAMHLRLWKNQNLFARSADFHKRRKDVLESNRKAIETLKEKSKPTQTGESLLKGLYALHDAILEASQEHDAKE